MDCNTCNAKKNCIRRGGVCQLKDNQLKNNQLKGDIMNKVDSDVKNQVQCKRNILGNAKCNKLCGVSADLKRKHCPIHGWMPYNDK